MTENTTPTQVPTAIITVGCPASGKTTWARQFMKQNKDYLYVNRDDIRFSLAQADTWKQYKFDREFEDMVTAIQNLTCQLARRKGRNVIICDTNLNEKVRNQWIETLECLNYKVEIKEFPCSLPELWRRDAERQNGVGKEVIYDMYQKWLAYKGRTQYEPDTSLPEAIIFDLDGTLASMKNRTPFEWSKVGQDEPVQAVVDALHGYRAIGYKIVILSGRDGVCAAETTQWLYDHQIPYDFLNMRMQGDSRKDTTVKEEMFWQTVAPKYNVVGVFDDRPCMVRHWQEMGLKVMACGNQNKEF